MKTIVFEGPGPSLRVGQGRGAVVFEAGKPQEVDDDLAADLLGRNPEGHDLESAARYGAHVFREVTAAGALPSSRKGGGEEVGE